MECPKPESYPITDGRLGLDTKATPPGGVKLPHHIKTLKELSDAGYVITGIALKT